MAQENEQAEKTLASQEKHAELRYAQVDEA